MFLLLLLFTLAHFTSIATSSETNEQAITIPRPIIYRNAPGQCSSNQIRCKEISRLDFCAHFCLWIFEGYLMLNVTFTVWALRTDELSFELGVIEDDSESDVNPPTLSGDWDFTDDNNQFHSIKIHHFRHSSTENPHYFRFEYAPDIVYSGNIIEYDEEQKKFQIYLYLEDGGVRTDQTLKGWLHPNGTAIEWSAFDINDLPADSANMKFKNSKFEWPSSDLPRTRGCYNWGPLDDYLYDDVSQHCGYQPNMGQYDGESLQLTQSEQDELDQQLNDGVSACPVCDIREQWEVYYACSERFKSMQSEANRCQSILSSTGASALSEVAKFICSSKLQLCMKFQSVTFTASKIELCPIPSINVVTQDSNGFGAIADAQIPDSNPVIFACIDFPVTSGLVSELNEATKTKFVVAGESPNKIAWYITAWEYTKIALFTIIGILFVRWILKKPPEITDPQDPDYEQFDDAKFFEEYGDFYSEETEETDEEDLYDDIF